MPPSSKYDFIDLTRAVAAVLVVASHAQQIIIDRPLPDGTIHRALSFLTTQGSNAVAIFFVISGYWIIRSIVNAGDAFSLKTYLLARGVRLWVVLIPALAVGGLLDAIGSGWFDSALYDGRQGAVSLTFPVDERLDAFTWLGNVLFLQDIAVRPLGSNGALWTLACEFWYYVYFAVASMAVRSRKLIYIVPVAAGLLILPSPHMFLAWLVGGLVYYAVDRRWRSVSISRAWIVVAAATLLAAICISNRFDLSDVASSLLVAAAFGTFMGVALLGHLRIHQSLGAVARFGAGSSYSLYATHLPLVIFVSNLGVPEHRMLAAPGAWFAVVVLTLVAVAFAYGFSLLTEARTGQVRSQLQQRLGLA